MKRKKHSKIGVFLLIALGAFILASFFSIFDLLKTLELKTLDARFQLRGTTDVMDSNIIVVGIDDRTFEELPARYPYPREYQARLIRNLNRAGARLIVFDIQFTEPDLKSPEGDSILAAAVKEAGNVILAGKIVVEGVKYVKEPLARAIPPIDVLLETGAEWGIVGEPTDTDSFTRRYLLYQPVGDITYLPLSLKALKILRNIPDSASVDIEDFTFKYGDLEIPIYRGNTMLVNYCGPAKTFPTYSFSDILDDSDFDLRVNDTDYMDNFTGMADLPPEFAALLKNPFKDKIVLIGATIEEEKDNFYSPFYSYGGLKEKTPGVEYHANALWTIMNGAYISTMKIGHIWGLMLLCALVIALAVYFFKPLGGLGALGIELVILTVAVVVLFNRNGLWVELTMPSLAAVFTFVGASGYQFISEQREKQMIKGMFQHYLAKSLVDELISNPDKLKLGGQKKELTVYFSDIENFTNISESLPPEHLLEYLNEYLTAMTDIILENDGLLDKYIGDAIVAVWGAPIMREDHAVLACQTALKMQRKLAELRKVWELEGKPLFKARMGINTGPMTIGNVGSRQRLSYTVIGDTVNLAARLEAINKQYNSYTMISEHTYEEAREHFYMRELDLIRVMGKNLPVKIYELLEEVDRPLPADIAQSIKIYHEGLKWYREREFEKALEYFKQALKVNVKDYPTTLHIERCRHFIKDPPPSDWDGVWVYMTK